MAVFQGENHVAEGWGDSGDNVGHGGVFYVMFQKVGNVSTKRKYIIHTNDFWVCDEKL